MTETPEAGYADDAQRYRLDRRIATGGMGEVWRGTDTSLGREVAIKLLKDEYADDPSFRTRFEVEAQHAGALHHHNIATVYDFGDHWVHDVTVETIEKHDTAFKRRLLDGARSFPREDCGGLPGYLDCVEVVATGEDPNELREWIGDWDPEQFDLAKVKRRFDK